MAVVDDHDVVRAGLVNWLTAADPPIRIVENHGRPQDFLAARSGTNTAIDAVLFDLHYGDGRPEFDALNALCGAGYRVVVFSHVASDEVILRCLDGGAVSFVSKDEGRQHLLDAIYMANTDNPYVAPHMARALASERNSGRPGLSSREREVLIAWFQTENKDLVGKRLFIEPTTVATHLRRARAKYAAAGRPAPTKAALVARAIQDGILSLAEL